GRRLRGLRPKCAKWGEAAHGGTILGIGHMERALFAPPRNDRCGHVDDRAPAIVQPAGTLSLSMATRNPSCTAVGSQPTVMPRENDGRIVWLEASNDSPSKRLGHATLPTAPKSKMRTAPQSTDGGAPWRYSRRQSVARAASSGISVAGVTTTVARSSA